MEPVLPASKKRKTNQWEEDGSLVTDETATVDNAEQKKRERMERFKKLKEAKKTKPPAVIPMQRMLERHVAESDRPSPAAPFKVKVSIRRKHERQSNHKKISAPVKDQPVAKGFQHVLEESQQSLPAFARSEPSGDTLPNIDDVTPPPDTEITDPPPTITPAATDSLDVFMVGVDKQMESDVVYTLNRLARFQRKEERQAAAKRAREEESKRSITLDEIHQQETAALALEDTPRDTAEEDIEESAFLLALKEHVEKQASLPPPVPVPKPVMFHEALEDIKMDADMAAPVDALALVNGQNHDSSSGVDDDENQQGAIDDFLNGNDGADPSYFELLAQHGSKKELQPVDHSQIQYEDFKKNLYIQVREVSQMKEHEVDGFRRTHGNIRIRGKGCPRPIREFTQCGLSDALLKVLEKKGCENPFPIQMQAIPALMAGRNVIGVAETGSGKTLAYLLPMLRHVVAQRPLRDGEGPIALVIGPTRELVQQIAQEANRYCAAVHLRCALVYGGGGIGTQLSELKRGAEIAVGTPGRLTEVLTINRGRICNLKRVTFLVLDEADRMFDLGFGPQVERIMNNVRPDRQMAMFSATFPAHIEALAKRALYKPLEIIVGEKGRTAASVSQFVEVFPDRDAKFLRLLKLLGEWYEHGESILVFANRQVEVDELCLQLGNLGYEALTLHGGQDQEERELALDDFKQKRKTILIATSVASRGLDVRSVVLVINYVAPDHLEDYVHRIGRTGRAGNIGVAFTFFTPEEADKADDVRRALLESGQQVPSALDELVASHEAQIQCGLVKSRKSKGFGGRGYKFTAAEKSAQQEAKLYWKKELGIGADGLDKDEDAASAADASELADNAPSGGPQAPPSAASLFASAAKQIQASVMNEINAKATALINQWTAAILDPVQKAQQTEALLPAIRQIVAQQHPTAAGVFNLNSGGHPLPDVAAMVQRALQPLKSNGNGSQATSRLAAPATSMSANGKGGGLGAAPADYVDPVTNNFVTTLSINDYPPQARHRVSHKETLTRVAETTGVALQVRGVFLDPERRKQNPLPYVGAKELHIEIIAPTQVAAQRAKRELHTLLETIAKKQLNYPATATGMRRT